VDTTHAPFVSPGDMPAKIAAFAKESGQPVPSTPGEFIRCCLDSLALTYRRGVETLEALLGYRIDVIHIVGGGAQNQLLNQMTADALNRQVIAGPYEATAFGNALTQAMGVGRVDDLAHLRRIVRASYDPISYSPRTPDAFNAQMDRFAALH
jgi:rhamnulokinase